MKSLLKRTPFYRWYFVNKHVHELWSWTARDAHALKFYRTLVHPGDLVFDIGANIGERAKVFDNCAARVVAVEPQPLCVRVMRRGLSERVRILQLAISDSARTDKLYQTDFHPHASMSASWMGARRSIPIQTTTLDALIASYGVPALIKIDVEGHELAVFRGLSAAVRFISFEFHTDRLVDALACVERLGELGDYEYNLSVQEELDFQIVWCGKSEIKCHLARTSTPYGDIYARLR